MQDRGQAAVEIAQRSGAVALAYFRRLETLTIEDKGPQDFVSDADKAVEAHVRAQISAAFPDDGIIGEEDAAKPSASGYTWVIDPIDGTANFIAGIPVWCVVIAVVHEDQTQVGVTYDPVHQELYRAVRGQGAWLNEKRLTCAVDATLSRGSISTGFSRRLSPQHTVEIISQIMARGGVFHRNASGAMSLAYVASGRLIGYIEAHMHAWDCLAGQLLIAEAGGQIEAQSANQMLARGGRVVAGPAAVFTELVEIADAVFDAP